MTRVSASACSCGRVLATSRADTPMTTPRACSHRRQRIVVRPNGARVQLCAGCGRVLATVAAAHDRDVRRAPARPGNPRPLSVAQGPIYNARQANDDNDAFGLRCSDQAGGSCRCRMNLNPVTGHCLQHDATRAAERLSMRAAGGRAAGLAKRQAREAGMTAALSGPAGMPTRLETLDDATKLAAWITLACLRGEIHARTAESATKGCGNFNSRARRRSSWTVFACSKKRWPRRRRHPVNNRRGSVVGSHLRG